jgi:decaprenyl-phosphate phosphoribosyltransferase
VQFLSRFRALFVLIRVPDYIKNLFVFSPLLFSKQFLDINSLLQSTVAFAGFCVGASSVYIFNDLMDLKKDRMHHAKSKRPLAAGDLRVWEAASVLLLFYAMLVAGMVYSPSLFSIIISYVVVNILYSIYFKKMPVFDIFFIASGFVLRVYAGGVSIGTGVSSWMFIVTLSLALYLASIKRRQELLKSGSDTREVLGMYTVPLLTKYAELSAACTIVFYSLFIALVKPNLIITVPFMLFGIYRYWYNVEALGGGESPTEVLLTDRVLQGTLIIWTLISAWAIMYGGEI